jgi:hypothetical protein
MSLQVETVDGGHVEARFTGVTRAEGYRIGEHEMTLEQFGAMTCHFLGGGVLGWQDNQTPAPVNATLDVLFELYQKRGDTWVRKV